MGANHPSLLVSDREAAGTDDVGHGPEHAPGHLLLAPGKRDEVANRVLDALLLRTSPDDPHDRGRHHAEKEGDCAHDPEKRRREGVDGVLVVVGDRQG